MLKLECCKELKLFRAKEPIWKLRVIEQTLREEHFGVEGNTFVDSLGVEGNTFVDSQGTRISSIEYPYWYSCNKELCVRGSLIRGDDFLVVVETEEDLDLIINAVREYNEWFRNKHRLELNENGESKPNSFIIE